MYQKEERVGVIVYLYYNRDVKKVAAYGDIVYHSKKRRYLQLYVPKAQAEDLQKKLEQEKFVKKVRACHIQELDKNFVGSLHRQEENVII
ncbi:YlbG family protein [Streptococcus gordonii]|uniref:YlbG family protein n=1 Tax=Streptococcus gordonii TaxID=1302 RepID=UPI0007790020|nr:YlbG family protein [Streptococcus gordonii]